MPHVVFLSGPVGAGKTSLGRELAHRLGAGFIDGDDHHPPGRTWYGGLRVTCRSMLAEALRLLQGNRVVIAAYPLNRITWAYFKGKLGEAGVDLRVVSLRASYEAIIHPRRGRIFSADEQARIAVMLAEGYAERPFSDLVFDSDAAAFDITCSRLLGAVQQMIRRC